jgi:hypothetical protein
MPIILDGTNGETFPSWTTLGRPSPASLNQTGYNTSLNILETYNGTSWIASSVPAPTTTGNVVFTADGTNWSTVPKITRDTAQATTSGTSKIFTGIPSWVKRITVILNGVSTNGGNQLQVQLGSGSIQSTGYVSSFGRYSNTTDVASSSLTSGFGVWNGGLSDISYGNMIINNISGNIWVVSYSGSFTSGGTNYVTNGGGNVTLSGTLDRIQLATTSTDIFDAGSVNILYE